MEEKRLNVGRVLAEVISIYKAGFRQFIGLSGIILIAAVIVMAVEMAVARFSFGLAALLFFVLLVILMYINIRVYVSMYKLAGSLSKGVKMTIKEAHHSSEGLVGTYFGVAVIYLLILAVPLAGIALSYLCAKTFLLKCGLIVLFGLPFAFLFTRYYLAFASALLSERMNGEFKSSEQLVKGDFWRVLIVIILTYGISTLIPELLDRWIAPSDLNPWTVTMSGLVNVVIATFTIPVIITAEVQMYLNLNKIKCVDPVIGAAAKTRLLEESETTDIQI